MYVCVYASIRPLALNSVRIFVYLPWNIYIRKETVTTEVDPSTHLITYGPYMKMVTQMFT